MVAFARSKAKSIFSKLRFPTISKIQMQNDSNAKEELVVQKERSSNYFLEAIKNGGIWLS